MRKRLVFSSEQEIAYDRYYELRRALKKEYARYFRGMAAFLLIPCFILALSVLTFTSERGIFLMGIIFWLIGIFIAYFEVSTYAPILRQYMIEIKRAKDDYIDTFTPDELREHKRSKRKTEVMVSVAAFCAVAALLCPLIVSEGKKSVAYNAAKEQILYGDMEGGERSLSEISGYYRDKEGLMLYCLAKRAYDGGNAARAYALMNDAGFEHLTFKERDVIDGFLKTIEAARSEE